MEGVEGLMKDLKLSVDERKKIRIGKSSQADRSEVFPKAFGKLMSEKEVRPETIEQAVGWIWCPMKGIECKSLGDNCFLFTFFQAAGKRKAMEDGPWMISKEILVVADFDVRKSIDEVEFTSVPIWIRVARLPMGMMNKETAIAIGEDIGEFMEVDFENDDLAAGRFLRVKVRIDIRKPLRRGVTVEMEEGEERWCPLKYEFLPDFCYICGRIGHIDKACSKKLVPGEKMPFDRELRYITPKKRMGGELWRNQESRGGAGGRGGGSGSWISGGSGSKGSWGRSRSDAPSWRKDDTARVTLGKGEDDEVTSPVKQPPANDKLQETAAKKSLTLALKEGDTAAAARVEGGDGDEARDGGGEIRHNTMQTLELGRGVGLIKRNRQRNSSATRGRRKKLVSREEGEKLKNKKRNVGEMMEVDEDEQRESKKERGDEVVGTGAAETNSSAGLSEQPCENQ